MSSYLARLSIILFFSLATSAATARLTSPMSLQEKINNSDLVLVGIAKATIAPSQKLDGVERYTVIEIQSVLYGGQMGFSTNFVTIGFSEELDPRCCKVGERYLLFVKRGFTVFKIRDKELGFSQERTNDFISAVNGPYSTYHISKGTVVGWKSGQSNVELSVPYESVVSEIQKLASK